jgi:hypothetical protein
VKKIKRSSTKYHELEAQLNMKKHSTIYVRVQPWPIDQRGDPHELFAKLIMPSSHQIPRWHDEVQIADIRNIFRRWRLKLYEEAFVRSLGVTRPSPEPNKTIQ